MILAKELEVEIFVILQWEKANDNIIMYTSIWWNLTIFKRALQLASYNENIHEHNTLHVNWSTVYYVMQ